MSISRRQRFRNLSFSAHNAHNSQKFGTRTLLALVAIFTTTFYAPTVYGAAEADDVGVYGSILIARKAHEAAIALKQQNWAAAQGLYKSLIGMKPDEDDFYFGLYEASRRMQQWAEVGGALDQLFQHAQKYRNKMALEYGECLFHQNKYSEAEPVLKEALTKIDQPSLVEKQLKLVMIKGIRKHVKVVGPIVKPLVKPDLTPKAPPPKIKQEQIDPNTSDVDLKLNIAYMKSECVLVATFDHMVKSDEMITFYNPPEAIYKIERILKGPPLNRTLPLRYEFHDKTNDPKPKGWKFNEQKMMPKKGSKWIIFIQNAVPVDRKFETYHGCWGRIQYTEDNIDKVLKIKDEHKGQS